MPEDNDNYKLLLEQIDALKKANDDTNKRLNEVIEFNRQLLSSRKPENNSPTSQDDEETKAAKVKLEKYIGGN